VAAGDGAGVLLCASVGAAPLAVRQRPASLLWRPCGGFRLLVLDGLVPEVVLPLGSRAWIGGCSRRSRLLP
jgi:hypothetical protein